MSKILRHASAVGIVGLVALGWAAGCSDSNSPGGGAMNQGASGSGSSQSTDAAATGDAKASGGDAASAGDGTGFTYTLIDDMETTTHGPIEFTGVVPPESPGYWFNFGGSAPGDTLAPPYTEFAFTALPTPTTTLFGKVSTHAAYELCALNGLYDVCGVGFEFAQVPATDDAGASSGDAATVSDAAVHDAEAVSDAATHDAATHDAATHDAATPVDAGIHDAAVDAGTHDAEAVAMQDAEGDGGQPGVPMVTVPFDISQYKGITFWGKTTAGDAGMLDVKVLFPDTDTDPRGGVCNGPNSGAADLADTRECFNSYTEHVTFTGEWQQFTVMFADLQQETTFGYMLPPGSWTGKNVYGIDWQGQDNNAPDSGTVTMDMWVDDVYFIQ